MKLKQLLLKKDHNAKLSSDGETVNIKIIVKTGSLEKEVNIELLIIIENQKAKQINQIVKSNIFLDKIKAEIEADGVKRASNLIAVTKTVININREEGFKVVFNDIKYDIVNDKSDDEIIASGDKTLNMNFNFKENNKIIKSSVKLTANLKGKTRKEINQYIAESLSNFTSYNQSFLRNSLTSSDNFFAQTVFANTSTYKELIDELNSSTLENNFYLLDRNVFKYFDDSESGISIEFELMDKTKTDLNEKMTIVDGERWLKVDLELHFFIGKGEEKYNKTSSSFSIHIMREKEPQRNLLLYLSKLRNKIVQGLFAYKVETKIADKYVNLATEIKIELNRLKESILKPEGFSDVIIRHEPNNHNQTGLYTITKESSYCRSILSYKNLLWIWWNK